MRDLALQAAGLGGILVAALHGILGETHVFARSTIEPPRMRLLLRLVWQAGTVAWAALGALLMMAPGMGSPQARAMILSAALVTYGAAGIGNAVATRGRHVGWMAMALVCGLALAGL